MAQCKTKVTTETGTFTFHKESVLRSVAELNCAKNGEILAPFTNQADVDAVEALLNSKCEYFRRQTRYYVGLNIKKGDNGQVRIFSNNEVWNQEKHGSLYKDYTSKSTDCPMAALHHRFKKPLIISRFGQFCETARFGYVCLKPAN